MSFPIIIHDKDRGALGGHASRWRALTVLVGISLLTAASARGDETIRLYFTRLTHREGLSQDSTNSVLQDHEGYIWVGTMDGLCRYSGYGFEAFRARPDDPNALADGYVRAMYEDSAGQLWISTDQGLHRLDPLRRAFRRYGLFPGIKSSTTRGRPWAFLEESPGRLLVGLWDGLFVLKGGALPLVRLEETGTGHGGPTSLVRAVARDPGGGFWVGADEGLFRIGSSLSRTWEQVRPRASANSQEELRYITSLCVTPAGVVWVGTFEDGLVRVTREDGGGGWLSHHFRNLPSNDRSLSDNSIHRMVLDQRGTLWIGTEGGLASLAPQDQGSDRDRFVQHHYDPNNPNTLGNESVPYLMMDRTGIIWAATYGGGVTKIVQRREAFARYTHEGSFPLLVGQSVQTIYEARDGKVWVGTESALHRFDPATGKIQPFIPGSGLLYAGTSINFKSILEDRDGTLWVGTSRGLLTFDRKTGRFASFGTGRSEPPYVRALYQDGRGLLWAGTVKGLRLVDRTTGALTTCRGAEEAVLGQAYVYTIAEDRQGHLLVGTIGEGLFELSVDSSGSVTAALRFRHNLTKPDSLLSNDVLSLCVSRDEAVWVGTREGLSRQENGGGFANYSEADGLPNRTVYSILEDSLSRLWMSTNNGISRLDPVSGSFRSFLYEDGLQNNEFNGGAYARSRTGMLFFGGIRGFCTIVPGQGEEAALPPPVVVTEISVNGKQRPFTEADVAHTGTHTKNSLQLESGERSVSFSFASLDFTDPRRNQYMYRLDNSDSNWVHSGHRNYASYTNLEPGKYIFRLRGASSLGVWNPGETTVAFEVVPLFWQSLWFKGILLALLVVLGGGAYRIKTLALGRRFEKENLQQKLKLKADLTAMIVHDLRTPLSCIYVYCELLAVSAQEKAKKNLGLMRSAANQMLSLINDMLDLSKFEAGKIEIRKKPQRVEALIEKTLDLLHPLLDEKKIELRVGATNEGPVELDGNRIAQVLTNLIGNAIKFSPSGGIIELNHLRIQKESGWVREVTISDEGPGIDEQHRRSLFNPYAQFEQPKGTLVPTGTGLGLAVSRLIMEMHGGEIGYRPRTPRGSIFYFRFPE